MELVWAKREQIVERFPIGSLPKMPQGVAIQSFSHAFALSHRLRQVELDGWLVRMNRQALKFSEEIWQFLDDVGS